MSQFPEIASNLSTANYADNDATAISANELAVNIAYI
jgi:hypothetical protein